MFGRPFDGLDKLLIRFRLANIKIIVAKEPEFVDLEVAAIAYCRMARRWLVLLTVLGVPISQTKEKTEGGRCFEVPGIWHP